MDFYSIYFLLFFVTVFLLNYVVSSKYRKYLIFAASSVFILSFNLLSLIVVFLMSLIFYFLARYINEKNHSFMLFTGILISFAAFIGFKYFNSIGDAAILKYSLLSFKNTDIMTNIVFPVGISFYLFQALSYLIEAGRKNIIPENNFINFFNYLIYFPKFLAGPIERPNKLISQLKGDIVFDYKNVTDGMKLVAIGIFQKFIIADSVKRIPDAVFYNPDKFPGLFILAGIILLSVQIYADFMGYTNMAIGFSKTLGIELSPNFRQPYFSTSIKDFWSRWHITLSLWIRDYVFLPIAYKITKLFNYQKKHTFNPQHITYVVSILLAMTLVGVWHGAGWTFMIWGLLHGVILAISFLTKKPRARIVKHLNINKSFLKTTRIVYTFAMITLLWVLFRADTLSTAENIFKGLFAGWHISLFSVISLKRYLYLIGISRLDMAVIFVSVIAIFVYDYIDSKYGVLILLSNASKFKRWAFYYILIFALMFFGSLNNIQNFIYQQF
ncbi:MAG: MBOAT family O-acyltransferase [Ignavibacteriota bacterium]